MGQRLRDIDMSWTAQAQDIPRLIVAGGEARGRGLEGLLRGVGAGIEGMTQRKDELRRERDAKERDNRDFLERRAEREFAEDATKADFLMKAEEHSKAKAEQAQMLLGMLDPSSPQAAQIQAAADAAMKEHLEWGAKRSTVVERLLTGYRSADLGAAGTAPGRFQPKVLPPAGPRNPDQVAVDAYVAAHPDPSMPDIAPKPTAARPAAPAAPAPRSRSEAGKSVEELLEDAMGAQGRLEARREFLADAMGKGGPHAGLLQNELLETADKAMRGRARIADLTTKKAEAEAAKVRRRQSEENVQRFQGLAVAHSLSIEEVVGGMLAVQKGEDPDRYIESIRKAKTKPGETPEEAYAKAQARAQGTAAGKPKETVEELEAKERAKAKGKAEGEAAGTPKGAGDTKEIRRLQLIARNTDAYEAVKDARRSKRIAESNMFLQEDERAEAVKAADRAIRDAETAWEQTKEAQAYKRAAGAAFDKGAEEGDEGTPHEDARKAAAAELAAWKTDNPKADDTAEAAQWAAIKAKHGL